MKKLILIVIVLALVGVGAGAYYMSRPAKEPDVRTGPAHTRGHRRRRGGDRYASGGHDRRSGHAGRGHHPGLYADFNSIVKKGQVIARLIRPSSDTQIEQQRANVTRSEAESTA